MLLHRSLALLLFKQDFLEPPLPAGWQWASTWTIDKSQFVDKDGWAYGPDFHNSKWPPISSKSCSKSSSDFVRRRRWIRTRQQALKSDVSVIDPGASANLPWRSTCWGSNQSLQIRPSVDHPQSLYSWGRSVTVGSGYSYGKDQALVEQVSLSRQYASKQENKNPNFTFKLDQLEKKDILLSSSSSGNKQFWLSVGTDASALHTELNAPVYDWRISVNAPLKLESRFPCSAEFTIWEKTKEGSVMEREHGIIPSRRSVHVYSADIQKPIYLRLLLQGGWVMEKVTS